MSQSFSIIHQLYLEERSHHLVPFLFGIATARALFPLQLTRYMKDIISVHRGFIKQASLGPQLLYLVSGSKGEDYELLSILQFRSPV